MLPGTYVIHMKYQINAIFDTSCKYTDNYSQFKQNSGIISVWI